MRRLGLVLCALWAACFAFAALAQQPLAAQFKPDLRVYPQFFSLAQGREGDLYIGGTDGILRFDGGRWHWLPLPRPGAVRALQIGRDGRLWFGAQDSFGYVARDASGSERIVDLAPKFAAQLGGRTFSDIWRIAETDEGLWFQALQDLFLLSPKEEAGGHWHHEARFGGTQVVAGELWVQWRDQGLKRRHAGAFEMLPGGERFAQPLVINLLELGDGRVLVHDRGPRLSLWQQDRFIAPPDPALAAQLAEAGVGIALDGQQAAFGGSDGQVRVLDLERARVEPIRVSNNFLVDLMRARDGSLMVLDISGVSRLDWPPRWRLWAEPVGSVTGAYHLAEFDGLLYASTWNGAFRGPLPGSDAPLALGSTGWTDAEAWALHRHQGRLLFAESKRLLRVDVTPPQVLSADDLYPRVFLDDPVNPDWLWLGTEHGVALLERSDDGYRLRHRDFELGWLVGSMVAHDGAIWVGDGVHGVRRLQREGVDADRFKFERVGVAHGLPAAEWMAAQVSLIDGALYASTAHGLFRYAQGRFAPDDLGGLVALLDEGETVALSAAPDGGLWAYSYHSVYRRGDDGRWSLSLLGGLHTGAILHLLPRAAGEAFVGAEAGVLQHRDAAVPTLATAAPARPRVAAARIVRGPQRVEALSLDGHAEVRLNGGSLEFEFAYPRFDGVGVSEFQFSIDPAAVNWSSWSNRPSVALLALPAGDYQLRLRARSRYGSAVEAVPFKFTIVPRWYQRPWVWPLAVFVAGGLIALALIQRQRAKVRGLREHNAELDRLVQLRTRELETANVQLRGLADSDGLTGLANRRHFDTAFAAAMQRARERGEALSLLLLDVDHFKRYNDSHGHQAGDDVLRAVAAVMRESVRPDTLVARYGGEEFAVVAVHCDAAQAHDIAARICTRLAARLPAVTLSIGIATRAGSMLEGPEILIARADAALYRAKHNGRNRIETDMDAFA